MKRKLYVCSFFCVALGLTGGARALTAAENLRGSIHLLLPANLTLYGQAVDLNNTYNNSLQVQICWDDPTLTHNCDRSVTANTIDYPFTTCVPNCSGFNYVVPTGTIGSVRPRDGNSHLMYVKIASQTNPGAGDQIMDGSPWPFTYRNGTAAQMWQANLEASPSRLSASQLAVFANTQDPYSVGRAGSIVCSIGGTEIRNDGIVGYYVQRHGVPCGNVVTLSVAVTPTISQPMFNAVILPRINSLSPSIQAIALGWVQPSVVTATLSGNWSQSISAVVAKGGMVTGTSCFEGGAGLGAGPINPYFNSASKTPFTSHGLRPTMMLAGEICPACSLENNYSQPWIADFPTAKGVIDAAVAGTDANPTGGGVYWAVTQQIGRSETALLASPLTLGNALSPFVNAQMLGSFADPAPGPVSMRNILLYDQSEPTWSYRDPSFIPGAGIGFSVTSFSGDLPSDGIQTNASSWLQQGAVAAEGSAVEPCELLVYKFPDPALVIPNYTQGQTVIEALWKSVRLPWQGNFLGDPLAAPFSLPAGGTAGVGPGAQGTAPVITSINPPSSHTGLAVTITLTGSQFSSSPTVSITGTGVSVSQVKVIGSTMIVCSFGISSQAPAGTRTVTVTTATGTSNPVTFTVL